MTCAYYLTLLGHEVTVFEALPVPGGVPRVGIPEYRLPKKVVDREIKEITELGVHLELNTQVGKDIAFYALTMDYDACFIATGVHRSMRLNIPGESNKGVMFGLDFLKKVAFGETINLGAKVAVIGGGNTAVDAARSARRLGAKDITIIYRRSVEEMPAYKEEVTAAVEEGIEILYLTMPVQIYSNRDRVSKLECLRTRLGKKDKDGRRRPEPVAGSNFMVTVNTVIAALGETLESSFSLGTMEMVGPLIKVDRLGRTSMARVYAGGDAATLSRSVVEAIASGKRAALGIDLFLSGDDGKAAVFKTGEDRIVSMSRYLTGDPVIENNSVASFEDINTAYFMKAPRPEMAELPAQIRVSSFDETRLGLSKAEAITEAERCFHCGHCTLCENCYIFCPDIAIFFDHETDAFAINTGPCTACGICIVECPRSALSWEVKSND